MIETFFTEKRIIKKLIIAIVFVFMFNFTFTYLGNSVVFATGEVMNDDEIMEEEGGGKLLLPIHSLLLFLSDALMGLMQNSFASEMPVTVTATANSTRKWSWSDAAIIVIGAIGIAVGGYLVVGAVAALIGTATAATGVIAGATAVATSLAHGMRRSFSRWNYRNRGFWGGCLLWRGFAY